MDKQKRKEIIIIVIMLLASVIAIGISRLHAGGSKVTVTIDGKVYGNYNIYENQEITIETEEGVNILTIKDGKAYVTYADCPDKICVNMPSVSEDYPGIIVCLPHKLAIEISE